VAVAVGVAVAVAVGVAVAVAVGVAVAVAVGVAVAVAVGVAVAVAVGVAVGVAVDSPKFQGLVVEVRTMTVVVGVVGLLSVMLSTQGSGVAPAPVQGSATCTPALNTTSGLGTGLNSSNASISGSAAVAAGASIFT
jgi:hypothetical protein